jgi:uncharacterized protein (TIGR03435 family)
MRTGFLLIAISAAWCQTTPSPAWKEFSIGPPTQNQSGFSREGIRAKGIPLKRALARAWGVPEHRILGPAWMADERYALTALVDNPDDLQPLLQQELTKRFQMAVHRETRELPVFVLHSIEGATPQPKSAPSGPESGVSLRSATVKAFAAALSDALGKPVFDETGIDGRFDLSLFWKATDTASLEAAVKQQLGMQLLEEKRNVEILVIDHIEKLRFDK